MKKNNLILSIPSVILSVAKNLFLIALLASCDKVPVPSQEIGMQLDEEGFTASKITVWAGSTAENIIKISMTEGDNYTTEFFYASVTVPSDEVRSVHFYIDESLVEKYSVKRNMDFNLLPAAFYDFDNGNTITLNPYSSKSLGLPLTIFATNPLDNQLPYGNYLLPVVATAVGENISDNVFYIEVTVREVFKGEAELYTGDNCFLVFYLNTDYYDPRLVTDYYMTCKNGATFQDEWYNAIGNIVNLRTITLTYDESTRRAMLNLGTNMRYLTQHYDTYIRPIQETGRKVCISIEGANEGIGFCNLTDEQIIDFVCQVKSVVCEFGFDGVNLWDRKSGYGQKGMPEMNTTSYPKLIVALREALGNQKLLTVTDYGEPTATFDDLSATGGIAVGKYIDYAWSGYYSGEEPVQIVDPYHQGEPYVSTKYPRKPISGLSPEKYGCLNIGWYTLRDNSQPEYENIMFWRKNGHQPNNIYVFEDIITYLQGALEAGDWTPDKSLTAIECFEHVYLFDTRFIDRLPNGRVGYGKWLKSW